MSDLRVLNDSQLFSVDLTSKFSVRSLLNHRLLTMNCARCTAALDLNAKGLLSRYNFILCFTVNKIEVIQRIFKEINQIIVH